MNQKISRPFLVMFLLFSGCKQAAKKPDVFGEYVGRISGEREVLVLNDDFTFEHVYEFSNNGRKEQKGEFRIVGDRVILSDFRVYYDAVRGEFDRGGLKFREYPYRFTWSDVELVLLPQSCEEYRLVDVR